ncbi:hypothetical protein CLF_110253, partial [Clonorchis sinensis]
HLTQCGDLVNATPIRLESRSVLKSQCFMIQPNCCRMHDELIIIDWIIAMFNTDASVLHDGLAVCYSKQFMTDKGEDATTISIEVAQEPATRILGFAPLQLSDDIYNVVNDNLGRMIDDFGEKLLERYQTKLDPSRVEKLLNVCKYKLQHQQDYLFDEFDKYLVGDLLSVDPNVVLDEDRCQLTYSEKKAHLVEARIDTYTKRLVAVWQSVRLEQFIFIIFGEKLLKNCTDKQLFSQHRKGVVLIDRPFQYQISSSRSWYSVGSPVSLRMDVFRRDEVVFTGFIGNTYLRQIMHQIYSSETSVLNACYAVDEVMMHPSTFITPQLNACSTLLDQRLAELRRIEKNLASFNRLLSDTVQTSFGVDSRTRLYFGRIKGIVVDVYNRTVVIKCSRFTGAFRLKMSTVFLSGRHWSGVSSQTQQIDESADITVPNSVRSALIVFSECFLTLDEADFGVVWFDNAAINSDASGEPKTPHLTVLLTRKMARSHSQWRSCIKAIAFNAQLPNFRTN